MATTQEWTNTTNSAHWQEIRNSIATLITGGPRGHQTAIGPSELGTECLHCLAKRLNGERPTEAAAWLPFVGTSVHKSFETYFASLNKGRFLTELRVHVSMLDGYKSEQMNVDGSIDIYDTKTRTTGDWKIVGSQTLRTLKAHGPSQQYKVQQALYAYGLAQHEIPVEATEIYFLPRNGVSLSEALAYSAAYDPAPAEWALRRATTIYTALGRMRVERCEQDVHDFIANLPRASQHGGHCFTCGQYDDAPSPLISPPTMPAGLAHIADAWQPIYTPTE